jgi:hypothetical protein
MAVAIPPSKGQSVSPKRTSPPSKGRVGSTRDPYLDAIVLACVVMFMLMAAGFGLLVLQQSLNWP